MNVYQKKRQEALEKILDCKFISINPNKQNYDIFCEIGRIITFISKFKNKKLKELQQEIKKLKEKMSL